MGKSAFVIVLLLEVGVGYFLFAPSQKSTPLSANGMLIRPGSPGRKLYIGVMKKWMNSEMIIKIIRIPIKYAPNFWRPAIVPVGPV